MKHLFISRCVRAGLLLGASCALVASSESLAARGHGPDPNKQPNIANPFFGEVVTVTATSITVRGDRKDSGSPNDPNASSGKLNIHFSIGKDVSITRDGKTIAATDIKKGENALVSFTMKDEFSKRRATEIKVGNVSAPKEEGGEKPKGEAKGRGKAKAGDNK
ncbi:MAG: hypothetical protein N2689_17225 [Verrucomicrobiae bacterium]|nr:hypothetical protein [Verrucomicrobiae bacterium]